MRPNAGCHSSVAHWRSRRHRRGTSIATCYPKRHEMEAGMAQQHPHSRIAITSRCEDCGKELGHAEFDRNEIANREIDAQQAGALPNRDAMSLVNANLALPINLALAANVLSDGSIAGAIANQDTPI